MPARLRKDPGLVAAQDESVVVQLKRLPGHEDVPLPARGSAHAAGWDLHAAVGGPVAIAPGEIVMVPLGFAMAIPEGYEAQIRPRSGLGSKFGITLPNAPGTIDADYRGEVRIPLINHGRATFVVTRGQRIAQMVIAAVPAVRFEEAEELPATRRAHGGSGARDTKLLEAATGPEKRTMSRPHLSRYILIAVAVAGWAFMLLACGSFSVMDPPSHAVLLGNGNGVGAGVHNLCGHVGSFLAYYCFLAIGQGVYPILLFGGVCLVLVVMKSKVGDLWLRAIGLLLLAVAFSAAVHQLSPGSPNGLPEGNGGLLGIAAGNFLQSHFNSAGSLLILVTAFLIGLLLAADELVLQAPKVATAAMGRVSETASGVAGGAARASGTASGWAEALRSKLVVPAFLRGGSGGDKALAGEVDEAPLNDRRVLLNRHNLEGDEVQLSYADDEPAAANAPTAVAAPPDALEDPTRGESIEIAEAPAQQSEATYNGGAERVAAAAAALAASPSGQKLLPEPGAVAAVAAAAVPSGAPPAAASAPQEVVVRSAARPRPAEPQAPKELGDYTLPAWSFLAEPETGYAESQEKYVREKAATLEQALRQFGLDARVVSIDTGPVITMYELALPDGMKVASITQLNNDIARALKAVSVRIVAPVPGKDTVGIEVPNPTKEKVRLKELFAAAPDAREKMVIPIFYGKDASGEALVSDITKMPHCLIAGTTGSGKSVCINTIVMSIIYHQRPDQVKLILIDPKVVELKPFEQIPHLMCPPINDPNKAPSVLEWLCTKMDERYELLAEAGVRQIADYNKLTREQLNEIFRPESPEEEAKIPKFMPYIVVIIDELADLMMMSGKEVEAAIVRLAQKSRAVGIHVILATQRPQANVVTGLIKANMPSRIAFRVQSRMDSRIVLDQNGAELLLGQGDMLFLPNGASKPIRGQGTYIDDMEVRQSVKLVKGLAEAQYEPELVQIRQIRADSEFEHDDLYDDAVKVVIETKRGSVSLLQRRLSIGYARSSRLIERMASTGILGDYKGSQSREVMFTLEEWEAAKAAQAKDKDEGMTV